MTVIKYLFTIQGKEVGGQGTPKKLRLVSPKGRRRENVGPDRRGHR